LCTDQAVEATKPRRPPYARTFNPDGNERLTAAIGLLLIVLSVVELATLVLGLQTYLHVHVFVGLVLLPPIVAKLASTGWRFARYYTRNDAYRLKGAPQTLMRLLAPLLVLFTLLLFGSGVAMAVVHGHWLTLARRIHGPAAAGWVITLGVHVLVYGIRALRAVAGDVRARTRRDVVGARLRTWVVTAAAAAGLAVGLATLPVQHAWLHLPSHHEHEH
jgi:hypothetical protein